MKINTLVLNQSDIEKTNEVLKQYLQNKSSSDGAEFVSACMEASNHLPKSIKIWAKKTMQGDIGLLKNIPINDEVGETPITRKKIISSSIKEDQLTGVLSSLFGRVSTLKDKSNPQLIHDVYPIKKENGKQLGASSEALDWHVEDGCHPKRPNWIGLFCIRADLKVATYTARINEIKFDENIENRLREAPFILEVDTSFIPPSKGRKKLITLLKGVGKDTEIIFDPAFTIIENNADKIILNKFKGAINDASKETTLSSGDFFILNNRKVLHARSQVHPRFDGTDRWLKRTLIFDSTIAEE